MAHRLARLSRGEGTPRRLNRLLVTGSALSATPLGRTSTDRSNAPLIGVVILNLRTRAQTAACLQSVAGSTYPNRFVMLVDNGCADFSAADVTALAGAGDYARTERNLGFAGGANLGMRRALAAGAQYVLLLNSDATIEPAALGELVHVATADPAIGIVGAKLLQRNNPGRLESVGIRVDLARGRIFQTGFGDLDDRGDERAHDVEAVSGAAMLFSRRACEQLGGFDERYFSYLEDIDLCLRARRLGFRVVIAPAARVHHEGKGSSAGTTAPRVLYYATRNHLMLMRQYGTGGTTQRAARSAMVIALNVTYALVRSHGTPGALRAVYHAVRDYRRGVVGESFATST